MRIKNKMWYNHDEEKTWHAVEINGEILGGYDVENYPDCNYAVYKQAEMIDLGFILVEE